MKLKIVALIIYIYNYIFLINCYLSEYIVALPFVTNFVLFLLSDVRTDTAFCLGLLLFI